MKDIKFDEILKRESREYIMRIRIGEKLLKLSVHGENIEVLEPCLLSADEISYLLDALPRLCAPAVFVINGEPRDVPEAALISAAEKNWSIII